MQYKVPQNVQREDRILWFITLRQFVIVLVGGGISYFLYTNASKTYVLTNTDILMIWLPAILALCFAFITVKGMTLFQFVLVLIEQLYFRQPRRYWMQSVVEPFVSLTQPYNQKNKKPEKVIPPERPKVTHEKIKNLAGMVDGSPKAKIKANTSQV